MANILDYLKTHASETMLEAPFHDADNLVLSQLSYLLWENGFEDSPCMTIAALWQRMNGKAYTQGFTAKDDQILLTLAAQSKRFSAIPCCNYISEFDSAADKQFAAISFLLPDDTVFVSFRGTDNSLTGWKEDFYLCLPSPIASQIRAADYLAGVAQTYPFPLRVGGHSKGGNLAVYAASSVSGDVQARLLAIYNNDGPGLSTAVFSGEGYSRIKSRVHTFVPQSSIIGMLLMHSERYTIVKSDSFSILQHNPYSWMIDGYQFIQEKNLGKDSIYIQGVLQKWLENVDDGQRQLFIDSLFTILQTAEAKTFDRKIWGCILRNPASVLSAVQGIDAETRQKLLSVIVALAAAAVRYEKLDAFIHPRLR